MGTWQIKATVDVDGMVEAESALEASRIVGQQLRGIGPALRDDVQLKVREISTRRVVP